MEGKGLNSKDRGWIQGFQQGVTEVILELGGEDKVREKYADTVKLWNEAGLPEELKRK